MASSAQISLQISQSPHGGDAGRTYGGWEHVDGGLMSIHLYGHPKTRPIKPATTSTWTSAKDMSKQTCNAVQYAKCATPCRTGWVHKFQSAVLLNME